MYNMDSPLPAMITMAVVVAVVLLLIAGGKVERIRIYDKCMAESGQMILAEATAKCKEVIK